MLRLSKHSESFFSNLLISYGSPPGRILPADGVFGGQDRERPVSPARFQSKMPVASPFTTPTRLRTNFDVVNNIVR